MKTMRSDSDLEEEQFPEGFAYMNGRYIALADAKVSVLDYGVVHSDATYDVVQMRDRRLFRLDHHIDRFMASMASLRFSVSESREDIRNVVIELARRATAKDALLAVVCMRGRPPVGSRDIRLCRNRFYAYTMPMAKVGSDERARTGLGAIVSSFMRIPPQSVDPKVKNYHWIDMVRSQWQAFDEGADVAVLLDMEGNVAEGPGFNVFCVTDNVVQTPDAGVLEGITRGSVIDICRAKGIDLRIAKVPLDAFLEADEIFLTSSAGGIFSITRINGRIMGNGVMGPVTGRIHEAYREMIASDKETVYVGEAAPA